jgi:hypothetical protein
MGPWAALSPALVISLACLAGLAALRFMQSTEWDLTWNGLIQARGMWLGRHVEGGRTIGVVFSHIAGVGAWAMLGWAAALQPWEGPWMSELPFQWDSNPSTPWHGAAIGAAIGLFSLPLRWFGRELCGWMSEVSDVAWQHGETDRLMRNVLSAMLIVEVLFVAVNSRLAVEVNQAQSILWLTFALFIGMRSIRLIQLILLSGLSIGWGIAYLCTLELIPTWALLSALFGK